MLRKKLILLSLLCVAHAAQAVELIAMASLSGNRADLASQTAGLLENGVAGNLQGGMGSGLAWAGGNTFIATPDRGPNATSYNPLVDDTSSYIARFQTLSMTLSANQSGSGLAFNLNPTLSATTLLSSSAALSYGTGALGTGSVGGVAYTLGAGAPALNAVNNTNYFTGRSDNFNPALPSSNPNNARLDPEAVRVSKDGKSVFVSDEYGPYVYQFDRATGQRLTSFALPANLAISHLSAQGALEIAGNTTGRVANKGMEGLAITPDGKMLVGIMQAPLEQDSKTVRIVTIDIATKVIHEYAYKLTSGSGVSEIVALNDHQFLVDERDGKGLGDGSTAVVKQLFKIDLAGAQDVTGLSGNLSAKAVPKSLLLDIVGALGAKGIAANQVPAKIEGLAFGVDVQLNGATLHTLYVANDNDFVPGTAGDNKFFVFGVSDADLAAVGATFKGQAISAVPEPESYAMLLAGLCLVGAVARRRKA
ncbi:MAG TPA: pyruvate-binding protein [Janthinobacterium sp.]|nr:pyruvate-binding protein [Janthinobacterium sp.]